MFLFRFWGLCGKSYTTNLTRSTPKIGEKYFIYKNNAKFRNNIMEGIGGDCLLFQQFHISYLHEAKILMTRCCKVPRIRTHQHYLF